jgi:hypothetical protein
MAGDSAVSNCCPSDDFGGAKPQGHLPQLFKLPLTPLPVKAL